MRISGVIEISAKDKIDLSAGMGAGVHLITFTDADFTSQMSLRMPEKSVAALRDLLHNFRTEEEAKVEAKAYGESQ